MDGTDSQFQNQYFVQSVTVYSNTWQNWLDQYYCHTNEQQQQSHYQWESYVFNTNDTTEITMNETCIKKVNMCSRYWSMWYTMLK